MTPTTERHIMKKTTERIREFVKKNPEVVISVATSASAITIGVANLLYYGGKDFLVIGRDGLQFLADNPDGALTFMARGRALVVVNAELYKSL